MNETPATPLHALCPGCGRMTCEHFAAELAQARLRVQQLEAAALAALQAGDFGISEGEGIARMQRLAGLLGHPYDASERPAPIARDDLGRAASEAERIFRAVCAEIGEGPWEAALFMLCPAPSGGHGHVIQVSRDRELTLNLVAHWMKDALDRKGVRSRKEGTQA